MCTELSLEIGHAAQYLMCTQKLMSREPLCEYGISTARKTSPSKTNAQLDRQVNVCTRFCGTNKAACALEKEAGTMEKGEEHRKKVETISKRTFTPVGRLEGFGVRN